MVFLYIPINLLLPLLTRASAEPILQDVSASFSISVSIGIEEPASVTSVPTVTDIPTIPASGSNYTSLDKNLTTITIVDPDTRQSRNIAYFVNQDGQAIVDDDILFGSEAYLLSLQAGSTPLRKRWYGVKTSYAWPDGIIHYKYESDAVERKHSGPMNESLKLWSKYAPYITFIKDPNDPKKQKKDVVTITSISGSGCYSNVALNNGGQGYLHINFDPKWSSTGRQYRHEWGHQLGLMHEHSHPDRERDVNFHCGALQTKVQDGCTTAQAASTNCCTNPTSQCCSLLHQFNNTLGFQYQKASYNPASVMHYPGDAFAKPHELTLTKVSDGSKVPFNPDISQGDVDGICAIYDYLCDAWESTIGLTGLQKTSGWTFSVPDPPYAGFSDWSLYPAPETKFLTLKGKRTTNTKCLSVLETSEDPGNPDPTSNALKLIPKGANFKFETMRDDPALPSDYCCINLYEDNTCRTAPFEKICRSTAHDNYLKKDLRS